MNCRCKNENYLVLVRPYAFGQKRIQLCRDDHPEYPTIVREMCTYDSNKAKRVVDMLVESESPEETCQSFVRPWNCEFPRGRIRLDNRYDEMPTMMWRADEKCPNQDAEELDL